jgi:hypothetical protein
MPVQRLHRRDMREHRIAAAIADLHQACDRSLPMRQFTLGFWQLEDCAASRSVTSGFLRGRLIGSKNR